MELEEHKMWRTYAWGYFTQHAEQRLKAFNFYVTFCAIVVSAFATIASRNQMHVSYIFLPLSLLFFSFSFWKLDVRTRMLIGNSERALKYLDELALAGSPSEARVLAIIKEDDAATEKLPKYPIDSGYFSYSRVFNWVFSVMGIIGLAGTAFCALSW